MSGRGPIRHGFLPPDPWSRVTRDTSHLDRHPSAFVPLDPAPWTEHRSNNATARFVQRHLHLLTGLYEERVDGIDLGIELADLARGVIPAVLALDDGTDLGLPSGIVGVSWHLTCYEGGVMFDAFAETLRGAEQQLTANADTTLGVWDFQARWVEQLTLKRQEAWDAEHAVTPTALGDEFMVAVDLERNDLTVTWESDGRRRLPSVAELTWDDDYAERRL